MPVIVLLTLTVGVPILIYSFVMFDQVVRAGYEIDRSAWKAVGKPNGFFWRAPESTFFSGLSTNRLALVWLFKDPPWAARSVACQAWLKRMRVCVVIWNGLFGVAIGASFIS